jgi:hypothetical protein
MKRSLLILVFACFAALDIAQAWPKEDAEEPIHISGILSTKVFPGLPNYESVAKGDQPEEAWIITSTTVPPGTKGKKADFQLVVTDDEKATFAKLRKLLGKRITVDGTVWMAHTGHHHTPYMITVKTVKEEKE